MRLLVTGGAGFIGSNFIRQMLQIHPDYRITNLDLLTYAGNRRNLADLKDNPRYRFIQGDIRDRAVVNRIAARVDAIVNFAAETHVDRSVLSAGRFVQTDVWGTYILLEAARRYRHPVYIQISTDEVYGSREKGAFTEESPLQPSSPYAASKAGGDLLARSYHVTHGLPVIITRCTNNFGPYQHPEKLIPLFITNALEDQPLPLYGDGKNVRDWIYVRDHCAALDHLLHHGKPGEVYNIGAGNERTNLQVTERILAELGKPRTLIKFVADRPGHDRRYAVNCAKLRGTGFSPAIPFDQALAETVLWYKKNPKWWKPLKGHNFKKYYKKIYGPKQGPE